MELSGKIAGSQINLTNGDVESMLFGDWSLNSTASSISFSATFTMMPLADNSDSNNATEYRIDNLRANTVQQINKSLCLEAGQMLPLMAPLHLRISRRQ